jgi:hypothetical protein
MIVCGRGNLAPGNPDNNKVTRASFVLTRKGY